MKKITNKIIFTIITCASIISVASLTKTHAQEINRNDLTAYKTDMSSIENETNIRTASEEITIVGTWDVSKNGDGSVTATLTSDGTLTIRGTGEIKSYSASGAPYYNNKENIKSVKIEEGVKNIGNYAFCDYIYLTSIEISDSVTGIGDYAFYGCSNLTSVVIPDSVINIGNSAFYRCTYLTSAEIGNGLTSIGDYAFAQCTNLGSIKITSSTTSVGSQAFYNCNKLKITVPCNNSGVIDYAKRYNITTNIQHQFKITRVPAKPTSNWGVDINIISTCQTCGETKTVGYKYIWDVSENGDNSVQAILTTEGTLILKGIGSMKNFDNATLPEYYDYKNEIKNVAILEGVTNIGNNAFNEFTNLLKVEISSSVTNIGSDAFLNCNNLENVTILNHIENIGNNAFSGCTKLTITLPCSNDEMINYATKESISINKIHTFKINDVTYSGTEKKGGTVTYICENENCGQTKEENFTGRPVDISDKSQQSANSYIIIDDVYAILTDSGTLVIRWGGSRGTGKMYTGLNELDCPYKGSKVKNIIIDEGVTNLANIFKYYSNLESVIIPSTVKEIGKFEGCTNLKSVIISEGSTNERRISGNAFKDCKMLTNIKIPNGVKSIGNNAFSGCTNLTNVTMPESVTSIGESAFYGCKTLTNMIISNKKATIGDIAFQGCESLISAIIPSEIDNMANQIFQSCYSLKNITIPDSVKSIGAAAFNNCISLENIKIPEKVESIGVYAICNCSSLTSIKIPKSVITIADTPFVNCANIPKIEVDEQNTAFCDIDGVLFNKAKTRLIKYPEGNQATEYTIPNSVTSIDVHAFSRSSNLTKITIPNSVTTIGNDEFNSGAFSYHNDNLTIYTTCDSTYIINYANSHSISVNVTHKFKISKIEASTSGTGGTITYTCQNCGETKTVGYKYIWDVSENGDNSVQAILTTEGTLIITGTGNMKNYSTTTTVPYEKELKEIKNVEIDEGVKNIGNYAFCDCIYLTSITIPDSVTNIGNNVFLRCSSLTSIEIPNSVTSIGNHAFRGCRDLMEITIPSNVTLIADYTFSDCSNLTSITIPESVTSIGSYAFYTCSSLTSVTIPNSVTSIGNNAFCDCSNLTSITIPNSVTSIGSFAFELCSSLRSVKIPNSVTSIENSVFYRCSSLTEIELPESVTSIGNGAFSCCSNLESIRIPNSVTNIGESAFDNCSSLTSVTIPEGVISIENGVFYRCSSLTKIELPESVTSIGSTAFAECSGLTSIDNILSNVQSIGMGAFHKCNGLTEIIIPSNVTGDLQGTFSNCENLTTVTNYSSAKPYGNTIFAECKNLTNVSSICSNTEFINYVKEYNGIEATKIHTEVIDARIEPTCETAGKIEGKHCSVCNEVLEAQEEIPALGHEYGEATYTWNEDKTECTAERICTRDASHKETETVKTTNSVTKEVTCEEVGERTYTATFTNTAFAQQTTTEEIPATGHKVGTAVEENRVESTCTQEGHYDEVIYCTVCNKEISRVQKTIKAKGHTYSTKWTIDKEATCEETGEKSHHCTECGERTDITTIEALGHDYQIKSTTDAVCEKGGTIIYECTKCKATKQETIPATGHREEIDTAVEPTCTEKGKTEGKHCSVCGKVLVAQEEIPAKGHTAGQAVEENRVESTCTQEGHYDEVIYCTECNTEISRIQKTIEKKEHTYSTEWTIDKEATCEETGEKSHHCTECGERTDITTIEALGHSWGEWTITKEPTFTEEGIKIRICANDETHKETETIAKLEAEKLLTKHEAKEATCEEAGNSEYYSYKNGEITKYYSDAKGTNEIEKDSWIIPAKGHTAGQAVEENRVESTCTQEGHYDEVIYCTECNTEISRVQKTIEKKEHTYSTEWTIDKEATCEETGEKSHHCTECGERTDITTIEALGHDYQIKSTTDAVCEKGGTIIYECTRCKTTKEETTPALGHKGGTPVEENRVEATCTENGSYDEVTYCKVCGEKLLKEKKTIPALGHDYEKIVVQPTETEQGYTLHICKRCKDEYKDNYVPSIDKKDPIQIKDDEKDITIIEKEEQKYIIVEPNTTVDRLKEAIIIEKEYTVIDKENKQKEGILATGDKITVKDTYKTSYIIIVKGDVNEDGVIDFMGDVVMLNNYRLGLIKLSKEAILAGDMNMDGKIDFVEDVVKINNYRISAVRSLIK